MLLFGKTLWKGTLTMCSIFLFSPVNSNSFLACQFSVNVLPLCFSYICNGKVFFPFKNLDIPWGHCTNDTSNVMCITVILTNITWFTSFEQWHHYSLDVVWLLTGTHIEKLKSNRTSIRQPLFHSTSHNNCSFLKQH